MNAHLLSLNDFNMPKVLDGTHAMYTKIVYLLLLEPGKYQSHPSLGLGLRSRYRFNNSENLLQTLHTDIQNQIERFLPELQMIDISLSLNKNGILGIIINTEQGAYALAYNGSTDVMDAPAAYVLDDL